MNFKYLYKIVILENNNKMEKEKINMWRVFSYFIIYSFLGFLLETIYAIFTKKMLESRQSFVFGPFCAVYGIAGTTIIILLKKYKNNNKVLYLGGVIIGILIEYSTSYIGEQVLHVKWWDYSNAFLNINGRICFYYSVIWGFLSFFLIKYFNPCIDNFIDYNIQNITLKKFKIIIFLIIIFMIGDCVLTGYALDKFIYRISSKYDIDIFGIDMNNKYKENYIDKYFSNEKMIMLFPNISVLDENKNVVYIGSIMKNVKNYYYKFEL